MTQVSLWKLIPNGNDFILNEKKFEVPPKSLDHISAQLPGGVYTTFRTFESIKALSLKKHFDRLEESAALAGKSIPLDHDQLRRVLREIVRKKRNGNLRVRITIDLEQDLGSIFISTEALQIPAKEVYLNGGKAITCEIERKNPQAKLTDHLMAAAEIRKKYPKEINEVLAVTEDETILEGLSSNFFAINNGEVWTAGENVLQGTVRKTVLSLANMENLPIRYQGVKMNQLGMISEAFITSTSRSILPITVIDDQLIGSGKPGKITTRLVSDYDGWVQSELEVI